MRPGTASITCVSRSTRSRLTDPDRRIAGQKLDCFKQSSVKSRDLCVRVQNGIRQKQARWFTSSDSCRCATTDAILLADRQAMWGHFGVVCFECGSVAVDTTQLVLPAEVACSFVQCEPALETAGVSDSHRKTGDNH